MLCVFEKIIWNIDRYPNFTRSTSPYVVMKSSYIYNSINYFVPILLHINLKTPAEVILTMSHNEFELNIH